ncbi:hypothetical protein [Prauserella muralis]|uniref:hypothetical protein n=1 Tax=Prauserella muralis TaxID=588067 RepID=UPI0011ACD8D3|nr:hypothetical protein [Prauserella muralis]TWE22898.1 hypothetical protein FHX69_4154 [Prauserella muralis]
MNVRIAETDAPDDDNRPGCTRAWAAAGVIVGLPLAALLGPVIVLKLAELVAGWL